MKAVIETTEWADGSDSYNHVYLLDGDQCLAYIPHDTREIRYLQNPIRMDLRRRTFQELRFNPFQQPKKPGGVVRVAGSRGNTYEVDAKAGTCTCPGFRFRSQCKHLGKTNFG